MAQAAQEQQQRRQPEQLEQCLTQRAEDELFSAWCNDNACEQTVSSKDKVRFLDRLLELAHLRQHHRSSVLLEYA
jgi:hypothetical protein